MGPFLYMQSIIDQNVIMQRMTVQIFKNFTVMFQ